MYGRAAGMRGYTAPASGTGSAADRLVDEGFMREALAEADIAAREGEVPIGAVVVYEGKVIARAHNRRELDEDPSAHAEFSAMLEAARALGRWRLSGCTVYVTLEPCCMCAGLMVNARIDRCVYGARDSKGGAVGTLYNLAADPRLNHRFSVTAGVLEEECAEVLRSFFGTLRNRATAGGQDGSGASAPPAEAPRRRGAAAPACGFASGQDGADACTAKAAAGKARGRAQALERAVVGPGGVRPRRVLVALDSFKGSASSEQANAWLAEGLHRGNPELAVETLPVGDGGEGTASALVSALGAERRVVRCHDLAGREVEASYLLFDESDESEAAQVLGNNAGGSSGRGAFIEMAEVAGLALSDMSESMALAGSTRGVGELLLDAFVLLDENLPFGRKDRQILQAPDLRAFLGFRNVVRKIGVWFGLFKQMPEAPGHNRVVSAFDEAVLALDDAEAVRDGFCKRRLFCNEECAVGHDLEDAYTHADSLKNLVKKQFIVVR